MIIAEEFECRVPTLDAAKETVIFCSGGVSNLPEIWSAIGTILASVIALGFGAIELYRSRQDRLRQELAEERANAEQQFRAVQSFMRQISSVYPNVNAQVILWMQSSSNTYLSFLRSSTGVSEDIVRLIESNLSRYITNAHKFASGIHSESGYFGEEWTERVAPVIGLMNLIDTQFESILSQWHRTGKGADQVLNMLQGLEDITKQAAESWEAQKDA